MPDEMKIGVNAIDAEFQLGRLDRFAAQVGQRVTMTIHKGYQSLVLFAEIFGYAIPEYMKLLTESIFMAANAFFTLAAAEEVTLTLAVKSIATFAMAYQLYNLGIHMRYQETAVRNKTVELFMAVNSWV